MAGGGTGPGPAPPRHHHRPEGVADEPDAPRVYLGQAREVREGGAHVLSFALALVEGAVAAARAPAGEAQGDVAPASQRLAGGDHDVVVHIAAVLRMGMADDNAGSGSGAGRGQRAL